MLYCFISRASQSGFLVPLPSSFYFVGVLLLQGLPFQFVFSPLLDLTGCQ